MQYRKRAAKEHWGTSWPLKDYGQKSRLYSTQRILYTYLHMGLVLRLASNTLGIQVHSTKQKQIRLKSCLTNSSVSFFGGFFRFLYSLLRLGRDQLLEVVKVFGDLAVITSSPHFSQPSLQPKMWHLIQVLPCSSDCLMSGHCLRNQNLMILATQNVNTWKYMWMI